MKLFGLALASAVLVTALSAAADDDSAVVEAKRLFDEATEELAAGNASVGRDLFRRALGLYSTPATRYNLAVALRLTGETTESIAVFEGLLREPSIAKQQRKRIEEELRGARGELATIVVRISGASSASVQVDGRDVGTAVGEAPMRLQVDAGAHVVIARAGGVTRQEIEVRPGGTATVDLHVLSLAEQNAEQRKRRRRKRAAWITSASVVVAAVVIAAVVTTRPSNELPLEPGDGGPIQTPALTQR